ncbi:MAG: hypothetical protein ACJ0P7_01295 [Flavobacteriaceae bacterium]|jgi:hypothetical protein|nr:hypothetical protein [uncultured bacterium]|tara:strand:- start:367 stop:576 length:210 start_codon:yes stop_codon:yes gene_type:complete
MKKPKKPPKTWAVFSGLTVQMGVSLYLASISGKVLDLRWETGKTMTLLLLMLVLAVNIYGLIKFLNRYK